MKRKKLIGILIQQIPSLEFCNEKCSCSCKGPTILDCLSCSNDNLENNYEIINLDLSFIEFKNLIKMKLLHISIYLEYLVEQIS